MIPTEKKEDKKKIKWWQYCLVTLGFGLYILLHIGLYNRISELLWKFSPTNAVTIMPSFVDYSFIVLALVLLVCDYLLVRQFYYIVTDS